MHEFDIVNGKRAVFVLNNVGIYPISWERGISHSVMPRFCYSER